MSGRVPRNFPALRWLPPVCVAAGLLAVWQGVSWASGVPHYLLPTPLEVGRSLVRDRAKLLAAAWITGREAGGAFLCSAAVGGLAATLCARWRWVHRSVLPYLLLAQTVPVLATAPLVLLWLGSGFWAVLAIAALISVFPVTVNATRGLLSVPTAWLDLFDTHAATPGQVLWKLRWPHALPQFFVGLRIAAGLSVVGAITGELFAGSAEAGLGGLGYSLSYANSQLRTDYLFALVAMSALLGFGFHAVVARCERCCVGRWHAASLLLG